MVDGEVDTSADDTRDGNGFRASTAWVEWDAAFRLKGLKSLTFAGIGWVVWGHSVCLQEEPVVVAVDVMACNIGVDGVLASLVLQLDVEGVCSHCVPLRRSKCVKHDQYSYEDEKVPQADQPVGNALISFSSPSLPQPTSSRLEIRAAY